MNKDNNLPDFTHVIKRIFTLTENIRKLRRAFQFSNSDARARADSEFIKKWREIEKRSSGQI